MYVRNSSCLKSHGTNSRDSLCDMTLWFNNTNHVSRDGHVFVLYHLVYKGGVLIATFQLCHVTCENQLGAGQFARATDHMISYRDQRIFPCVF